MATATSKLQIIIDVLTGRSKQELQDVEKGISGLSKAFGSVTEMAVKAGAAIVGVGATMKKAFDLGREGAVITQTAESFELLLNKVNAAPDLLYQLQEASRNTISEMDIMTSTATLLAGATGQFGNELANATPKLMEIAKAANKLNPALGTTAHMYQSLATGIKRLSPLILDNLGLIVKVGEANQKYADQIGKTVGALTAEEEELALLNATIEAGNALIEQVGGTTASATDSFDQMNVAIEEQADIWKQKVMPSTQKATTALFLMLKGQKLVKDAADRTSKEIYDSTDNFGDYKYQLIQVAEAAAKAGVEVEIMTRAIYESSKEAIDADQVMLGYALGTDEVTSAQETGVGASSNYLLAQKALAWAFWDTNDALSDHVDFVQDAEGATDDYNAALSVTKSRLDGVNTGIRRQIDSLQENIEWVTAGGKNLNEMYELVKKLYEEEIIDGDTAEDALLLIKEGAVDLDLELGKITTEEAVAELVAMGVPIDEAKAKVLELEETLFRMIGYDWRLNVIIDWAGGAPPGVTPGAGGPGAGGPSGGGGGAGYVPPIPPGGGGGVYVPPEARTPTGGGKTIHLTQTNYVTPQDSMAALTIQTMLEQEALASLAQAA